ncbi:MAG: hypothetical protein DRN00_02250 [Thermoplasmata archaeon]|nr:MAG: hypothetical protein DRN00_02250 [Thermoplasmata archaeon]
MAEKNLLSNPAPLGLMGFGMTTVLLNLHNAGLFDLGSMILAMGIFYGGLAQVFAGLMEFRRGNTFGTTAFCSYGLFWLSLVAIILLPSALDVPSPSKVAMASYLFMWGLFTFMMFLSTLKISRASQVVFLSLAILFWLLALGEVTGMGLITRIAGIEGIFCGFSAIYLAIAEVTNEVYGREVLPIGKV